MTTQTNTDSQTPTRKPPRYEKTTGFRHPDVADSECINCGIGLTEAPDHDDVHPIRMLYETEDGERLCEACFFQESYDRTGRKIAHDELETFYRARKHRDGEPNHRYDYYYFETHQAASSWAQTNDGEYQGSTTVDPFKLSRITE
ncbi:MAG: hypothetical protein ABEI86_07330 [Halobacteriaceae archaeon]